jgi:hypothetical protein
MEAQASKRYRLNPEAAYLRDIGYVFIDLRGRIFRMDEAEFHAFRACCAQGMDASQRRPFGDLLLECDSVTKVDDSFIHQEIQSHDH